MGLAVAGLGRGYVSQDGFVDDVPPTALISCALSINLSLVMGGGFRNEPVALSPTRSSSSVVSGSPDNWKVKLDVFVNGEFSQVWDYAQCVVRHLSVGGQTWPWARLYHTFRVLGIQRTLVNITPDIGMQDHDGKWRCCNASRMLLSVPRSIRYTELMCRFSQKTGQVVAAEFQKPGDELIPDELIPIRDDSDVEVGLLCVGSPVCGMLF